MILMIYFTYHVFERISINIQSCIGFLRQSINLEQSFRGDNLIRNSSRVKHILCVSEKVIREER